MTPMRIAEGPAGAALGLLHVSPFSFAKGSHSLSSCHSYSARSATPEARLPPNEVGDQREGHVHPRRDARRREEAAVLDPPRLGDPLDLGSKRREKLENALVGRGPAAVEESGHCEERASRADAGDDAGACGPPSPGCRGTRDRSAGGGCLFPRGRGAHRGGRCLRGPRPQGSAGPGCSGCCPGSAASIEISGAGSSNPNISRGPKTSKSSKPSKRTAPTLSGAGVGVTWE